MTLKSQLGKQANLSKTAEDPDIFEEEAASPRERERERELIFQRVKEEGHRYKRE